ncbi:MAG: aspartate aminotransferase family protein [Candidatus Riflebacteria bacterium]|nr:aspartate aminotransferase family protein [Candidatus Riflebacteria bacterium]
MIEPKLFHFVNHYYDQPLIVERAKDCWIFDSNGRKFLDGYSGVASISVGHANPFVNKAVCEQIELVNHCPMIYQSKPLLKYLNVLQKELPENLNRHFFVNSGSEAIDFACQALRTFSNKPLIIAFSEGFHGGTFQAKSVTGLDAWQPIFGKDENVFFQPISPCKKCPEKIYKKNLENLKGVDIECTAGCLMDLDKFLEENSQNCAGIIIEPILGVGGIILPMKGFFQKLDLICRKYKIPLIVDEVQTGFGRCGSSLFAFQKFGLHPDILCMAKGIANGFPMGLVSASEEISMAMGKKLNFSTFGGNPVSCVAATYTLKYILEKNLLQNSEEIGKFLQSELEKKLSVFPFFREIRGCGLIIGIEVETGDLAKNILISAYKKDLLIGIGGRNRNVLRIEPSLTFSKDMAEMLIEIIVNSFQEQANLVSEGKK